MMTFNHKADAIRAAKRLGHRYVLYRRTGALFDIYETGDYDRGLTIVWEKEAGSC